MLITIIAMALAVIVVVISDVWDDDYYSKIRDEANEE